MEGTLFANAKSVKTVRNMSALSQKRSGTTKEPSGTRRVYKRLRSSTGEHPALIKDNKLIVTSKQTWAYLLCSRCEQRLSNRGERWVLTNGLQRDAVTFPLLTELMKTRPTSADRTLGLFQPPVSKSYDPASIGYFAVSIFWRAAVHTWGQPDIYPIRLGPYKEQLRKYLMDERPFPENGMLMVVVRAISPVNQLTYHPATIDNNPTVHLSVACGFVFLLTLGANVLEEGKPFCILNGQGHPITVTNELELNLFSFVYGRA